MNLPELKELKEKVYPEDIMIVAVNNDTDYSYVKKILNGTRKVKSDKSKAIVVGLKKMARINDQAKRKKQSISK